MKKLLVPAMAGALCLFAWGFSISAAAGDVPVQPAGRILGQWTTDEANVAEYLSSILLPASAQCSRFEGRLVYAFTGGATPTMTITGYGPVVHLEKGRLNGPADQISFGLNISFQSAYSISHDGTLLDFGFAPDVNSVAIDNLIVNGNEVMRESGDISMLGLSIPFAGSQMQFELMDGDRLKLVPVIPPSAETGMSVVPSPLILHRR